MHCIIPWREYISIQGLRCCTDRLNNQMFPKTADAIWRDGEIAHHAIENSNIKEIKARMLNEPELFTFCKGFKSVSDEGIFQDFKVALGRGSLYFCN